MMFILTAFHVKQFLSRSVVHSGLTIMKHFRLKSKFQSFLKLQYTIKQRLKLATFNVILRHILFTFYFYIVLVTIQQDTIQILS